MEKNKVTNERRKKLCTLAPEWAEHARLYDDGEPCDDGRQVYDLGRRAEDAKVPVDES